MIQYIFRKIYWLAPKWLQDKPFMHMYRDFYMDIVQNIDYGNVQFLKKRWYIHPILIFNTHYWVSVKNHNRLQIIKSLKKDRLRRFNNMFLSRSKYECLKIKLKMLISGTNISHYHYYL